MIFGNDVDGYRLSLSPLNAHMDKMPSTLDCADAESEN